MRGILKGFRFGSRMQNLVAVDSGKNVGLSDEFPVRNSYDTMLKGQGRNKKS